QDAGTEGSVGQRQGSSARRLRLQPVPQAGRGVIPGPPRPKVAAEIGLSRRTIGSRKNTPAGIIAGPGHQPQAVWYALMSNQIPVRDITPKSAESVDLYAKREKIYTRSFKGLFRNLRLGGGALLFILYFGTVWLNWGDRQA